MHLDLAAIEMTRPRLAAGYLLEPLLWARHWLLPSAPPSALPPLSALPLAPPSALAVAPPSALPWGTTLSHAAPGPWMPLVLQTPMLTLVSAN